MIDHELKIGEWVDTDPEIGRCKYCGWGSWVEPSCVTSAAAMACALNKENVRKFTLRFRNDLVPDIVKSTRYQGKDGKGDSYEFLERIE